MPKTKDIPVNIGGVDTVISLRSNYSGNEQALVEEVKAINQRLDCVTQGKESAPSIESKERMVEVEKGFIAGIAGTRH